MSQNDLTIANQGFASFRSDLNSALQALGSTNSGTSAPSTTFANQLFYDTTNNILKIRNEDNDAFISLFTLDQTNDLISGFSSPITITTADNNPQLTLVSTDADSSSGAILEIQRDSASPADGDAIGQIKFTADNDAGQSTVYGSVNGTLRDASDGTEDGQMQFSTMVNGSTADFFRYGVDGVGEIGVIFNEGSIDADFRVESDNDTHAFFLNGASGKIGLGTSSTDADLHIEPKTGNTDASLLLSNSGRTQYFRIQNNETSDLLRINSNDTTNVMDIDSTGAITMPKQPAFSVHKNGTAQNNFAINTANTVTFGSERFDNNADFSSNTFTAPTTGKYFLSVTIRLESVDTSANFYAMALTTSNQAYNTIIDPNFSSDLLYLSRTVSIVADMDSSDTASVQITQSGGTAQTDVNGEVAYTYFSGYLLG